MPEKITDEELERMSEYVRLLERAEELRAFLPSRDEVELLSGYVRDLQALSDGLREHAPSDDDATAVSGYLADLRAIRDELSDSTPTESESKELAEHMANNIREELK